MRFLRKADERGLTKINWLNSHHTFSFGDYWDPKFVGFSDLLVINDDIVKEGKGFGTHPHKDMEIISIVLSGELEHKDSMGNGSIIKAGEVQKMSAGTGITHSEFNPRDDIPVHFLQIWILPNEDDIKPMYDQKRFDEEEMKNKFRLIVSNGGKNGSIHITQDAAMYQSIIDAGKSAKFDILPDRAYWIHIAEGKVEVDDQVLSAGDGLAVAGEEKVLSFKGVEDKANVLVIDLSSL